MRPRTAILMAAATVYVIANWIPFGDTALYPLTLFTTWVHEMGHGLTALALGGSFESLKIFRDAAGLAICGADAGWREAAVCAGGLLAPPLLGSILLATVHGLRSARIALVLLATALVISLAIYVRSIAGVVAMPLVALGLAWSAWPGFRKDPEYRVVLVQALALILALDTLTRMVSYVFTERVEIDGVAQPSDIQMIADNLGGAFWMWGILITAIALSLLAAAAWWAWRRPKMRGVT